MIHGIRLTTVYSENNNSTVESCNYALIKVSNSHVLRGLLSRPPSLERNERQGLFFVMPIDSLVVDSTFEQSENIAIAVVSSSSCLTCIDGGI